MPQEPRRPLPRAALARARCLRKPQTPAESTLWRRLRDRQLGFKFRRQHPIGQYVVDFFCDACRLVVEIDGDSHAEREQYDAIRTEWLNSEGYRVIRFNNEDVRCRLDGVLAAILDACEEALPTQGPPPSAEEQRG